MPSDAYKIVIHADKTPAREHVQRFNAPTINEVAIAIAVRGICMSTLKMFVRRPDLFISFTYSPAWDRFGILELVIPILSLLGQSPMDRHDTTACSQIQFLDTAVEADEAVNYKIEYLNLLDLPGMLPHMLQLKIGVPIIMLRNINQPKLCYGTRFALKVKIVLERC
ncbi:unnamed protein product [Onchocerca ochengi]|uniref:ATP-dependent DNA helicase n=1 Tax=Onchocerca ochengi TaxID=42157 RepID=A0A182ELB0_ONCOC|nr:unnamed protein product [Onchocerca ochengi]